ncbi:putative tetratricopeptide-like helical domain superfamily, pentacotripeptide-repeat region of PRORP [Dioscorea sansibarensis]
MDSPFFLWVRSYERHPSPQPIAKLINPQTQSLEVKHNPPAESPRNSSQVELPHLLLNHQGTSLATSHRNFETLIVPSSSSSCPPSSLLSMRRRRRRIGSILDWRNGFLCTSPEKRSSFGCSFVFALSLEQEPVSGCVNESEDVSLDTLEGMKDDGDETLAVLHESYQFRQGKVDVRALALSIQDAKTSDDVEAVFKYLGLHPLPVYSSIIRGFGNNKRIEPAIALVEWLKRKEKDTGGLISPNLFIYNSLLGAIKQAKQFGKVDEVMEDMKLHGIVPNIVTYNALMSIFIEQERPDWALDVLVDIEKNDLSPSPVTYSTALLAYREKEDVSGAIGFFAKLREKYKQGEIGKDGEYDWKNEFAKLEDFTIRICYLVIRQSLVKEDHPTTKIFKLLHDMDEAGFQLGRKEYERLVWACTRESHYAVAKELYRRIRDAKGKISLSVCNHVIWLMGKAKKWWAALEIYEELLDRGPKPNNVSYELIISNFNVLLNAARRRGIWRWGVRLLNKMQEKGLKPGTKEWNAVLVACSKASETTAAVQIFKRMVEQGEKPTILSYGALLSALEKGKMYDEALQVWEHMCKVCVKPNLHAYTILASIYIGKGRPEMVDEILREMSSSGIEPSVVTYNAIITGCCKDQMSSAALEWFHRMKVKNLLLVMANLESRMRCTCVLEMKA